MREMPLELNILEYLETDHQWYDKEERLPESNQRTKESGDHGDLPQSMCPSVDLEMELGALGAS